MKITFVRHVFATLTYDRNITPVPSVHFNRYIQQLRRKFKSNIEYFRCFELQRDGTPHFHVLLQFPYALLKVNMGRYFESRHYRLFKGIWKYGLTDYQPPRTKATAQLTYIMKYLSKNCSTKTVWKKIYSQTPRVRDVISVDTSLSSYTSIKGILSVNPVYYYSQNYKIKLLTWSRKFDFTPFTRSYNKIALSNLDFITPKIPEI